eukprot:4733092-Amphidinium_carterae.1
MHLYISTLAESQAVGVLIANKTRMGRSSSSRKAIQAMLADDDVSTKVPLSACNVADCMVLMFYYDNHGVMT